MGESIGISNGWLGKIVIPELYRIGYGDVFSFLLHHSIAYIMIQGRTDIVSNLPPKFPRVSLVRFLMDDYLASYRAHGSCG